MKMISKIYNSNQILFKSGSRKGKAKEQIALMIEKRMESMFDLQFFIGIMNVILSPIIMHKK